MDEVITENFSALMVDINGHSIGGVKFAEINARRECITGKGFGESVGRNHPVADSFQITLRRVVMPGNTEDFFPLKGFRLTVMENGSAAGYSDCQWVQIKDTYDIQQGHTQELTFTSPRRRLIKEETNYGG